MSKALPRVRLGPLDVSRLCFGTLTMGPMQRALSVQAGSRLLFHAWERGITFFDTAQSYGTYAYLRELLRAQPGAQVSTKTYAYDAAGAEAAFVQATRELGRGYIDVFLLHEQESEHTLRGHREALEWLIRRKEAGEIGAVGLSTHHVAAVRAATRFPIDIVHPIVNRRGLGVCDGTAADMEAAIAAAHAAGIGIFAMKPLGGGHLIGDDAALPYVLALRGVDAVAIGMQSEAEIDVNAAIVAGEVPDAAAITDIERRERRLLVHDWCEGCGKCVARCGQRALSLVDDRATVDHNKCVLCGYCAAVCPVFCLKVI